MVSNYKNDLKTYKHYIQLNYCTGPDKRYATLIFWISFTPAYIYC